jgi:hypothetical protein
VNLYRTGIDKLLVASNSTAINVERGQVKEIQLLDANYLSEKHAQSRSVDLQSSLPPGAALQPSSTVVYTAVLNVRKRLFFTPSKFRLQFNVNYAFQHIFEMELNPQKTSLFTNTISYEIAIRPSLFALITGAGFGAIAGSLARSLQSSPHVALKSLTSEDMVNGALPIILSLILGIVAVIFVARKSEAQSFISVEDFWGGLLIGFFVGYTGTEFFSKLTDIQNVTTPPLQPPASPAVPR